MTPIACSLAVCKDVSVAKGSVTSLIGDYTGSACSPIRIMGGHYGENKYT